MNHRTKLKPALLLLIAGVSCQSHRRISPRPLIERSQQLVVVTTPGWTSTTGTIRRFERSGSMYEWRAIDQPVPVVVGRTGIAWGVGFDGVSTEGPHKREGDGKSPAGMFPLDTVFGFAPPGSMQSVRMPYVQLLPSTDCVDDTRVVPLQHGGRPRVGDSRRLEQRRAHAEHKAVRGGGDRGLQRQAAGKGAGLLHLPPRLGGTGITHRRLYRVRRGEAARAHIGWLDPKKRPLLVQLTTKDYRDLRTRWSLPVARIRWRWTPRFWKRAWPFRTALAARAG